MIKIYRLKKGFKLFDVESLIRACKKQINNNLEKEINEDFHFANDKIKNNTKIEQMLMVKFTLKIFKLILVILNSSYLLGMIWLIWCQIIEDFILDVDFSDDPESYPNHFTTYYELLNYSPSHITISMTYYSFTSLSTVGFGDFHPVSHYEQATGAFVLLFGILLFSYSMGELINLINFL